MNDFNLPVDACTDERFHAATEPLRLATLDLVEQTERIRNRWGWLPAEESPAMAELSQERFYAGGWGAHPVADAHSLSWTLVAVAENLIRSLCSLYESPTEAHVYAHVILGRAIVEGAARGAWLAAPDIDVRRRVARGQTERLYSLNEVLKIEMPGGDSSHERGRREKILEEATRQRFRRLSGKNRPTTSLEEHRPRSTQAVRWLFAHGGDDDGLGEVLYRWWSAMSHSTVSAVMSTFEPQGGRDSASPLVRAGMYVSTAHVHTTFMSVVFAYHQVTLMHATLFGWVDADRDRAALNLFRLLRERQPQSSAVEGRL